MKSVFVSSTFGDMQAERDAMMIKAMPEINSLAKQYGQSIRFVDLRWGINTSELEKLENSDEGSKKVLSICLDQIESSKPYMVILIGERYGWLPGENILKTAAQRKKYELDSADKSVTQLEIEFGALSKKAQLEKCLFYFRQPLDKGKIPQEFHGIYIDSEDYKQQKLANLKQLIISAGGKVKHYSCAWDKDKNKLSVPDEFVNMVTNDVTALFKAEFYKAQGMTWHEKEELYAKVFTEFKAKQFSSRYDILEKCVDMAQNNRLSIVQGQSGVGKSTVMSKLSKKLQNTLFIACGNSANSQSALDVTKQIVYKFEKMLHKTTHFENTGAQDIEKYTDELLGLSFEYSRKIAKPFYIIIDAIDQLTKDENRDNMKFLPTDMPDCVGTVVSCLDSFNLPPFYPLHNKCAVYTLKEATDKDKPLILKGLSKYFTKELNIEVSNAIIKGENSGSPLYLSMVMQRLVMLDGDDFENVKRKGNNSTAIDSVLIDIVENSPKTVTGMCAHIIKEAAQRINYEMCMATASLIATARRGLRESDLEQIFAQNGNSFNAFEFKLFIKYLQTFFIKRQCGRIDFAHNAIRKGFINEIDVPKHNKIIHEFLKTLSSEDEVKIQETVYHAFVQDDKKYLVNFMQNTENFAHIISRETHDIMTQNITWTREFFDTITEDNSADIRFVSFVNKHLYSAFGEEQKELEALSVICNKTELLAEDLSMFGMTGLREYAKALLNLSMLSNKLAKEEDFHKHYKGYVTTLEQIVYTADDYNEKISLCEAYQTYLGDSFYDDKHIQLLVEIAQDTGTAKDYEAIVDFLKLDTNLNIYSADYICKLFEEWKTGLKEQMQINNSAQTCYDYVESIFYLGLISYIVKSEHSGATIMLNCRDESEKAIKKHPTAQNYAQLIKINTTLAEIYKSDIYSERVLPYENERTFSEELREYFNIPDSFEYEDEETTASIYSADKESFAKDLERLQDINKVEQFLLEKYGKKIELYGICELENIHEVSIARELMYYAENGGGNGFEFKFLQHKKASEYLDRAMFIYTQHMKNTAFDSEKTLLANAYYNAGALEAEKAKEITGKGSHARIKAALGKASENIEKYCEISEQTAKNTQEAQCYYELSSVYKYASELLFKLRNTARTTIKNADYTKSFMVKTMQMHDKRCALHEKIANTLQTVAAYRELASIYEQSPGLREAPDEFFRKILTSARLDEMYKKTVDKAVLPTYMKKSIEIRKKIALETGTQLAYTELMNALSVYAHTPLKYSCFENVNEQASQIHELVKVRKTVLQMFDTLENEFKFMSEVGAMTNFCTTQKIDAPNTELFDEVSVICEKYTDKLQTASKRQVAQIFKAGFYNADEVCRQICKYCKLHNMAKKAAQFKKLEKQIKEQYNSYSEPVVDPVK